MYLRIAGLMFVATVIGCREPTPPNPIVNRDPFEEPAPTIIDTPRHLAEAPNEVMVGNCTIYMETELWRDFTPIIGLHNRLGQPLFACFGLDALDGAPFPMDIQIEKAWIVLRKKSWEIDVDATGRIHRKKAGQIGPSLVLAVHGGPKWGPDELVDVVIKFRDGKGVSHLLQAKNQMIGETS